MWVTSWMMTCGHAPGFSGSSKVVGLTVGHIVATGLVAIGFSMRKLLAQLAERMISLSFLMLLMR